VQLSLRFKNVGAEQRETIREVARTVAARL
jgi:hypothetical protein